MAILKLKSLNILKIKKQGGDEKAGKNSS